MLEKHCDCGRCNCCNGYVQDANNPNRYVNLETGEVRKIDKQNSKFNWLILWLLIVLFLANQSQIKTIKPSQTRQNSQTLVN